VDAANGVSVLGRSITVKNAGDIGGAGANGAAIDNTGLANVGAGVAMANATIGTMNTAWQFFNLGGTTDFVIGRAGMFDALRLNGSTGSVTLWDAANLAVGTTTGTKIGTATNQKLSVYNATPVVQGAAVADATGGSVIDVEGRAALNALLARIRAFGIIAA
jgi:hypothetical protein